jgi:hypothetical protein
MVARLVVDICMLGLLASCLGAQVISGSVALTGTIALGSTYYNWYVDSANGSDSNSGTSFGSAFQTLSKLQSVMVSNQSACLAKGSEWREQLNFSPLTLSHITLKACGGAGGKPIINAADILAGSWSLAGGYTQTYQYGVSVTAPTSQSGGWMNVFEGGAFLARASSVADCDTNAAYNATGCYYLNPPNTVDVDAAGAKTLWIRTSDGSNPTTNGRVYEATVRDTAIDTIMGTYGAPKPYTYFSLYNVILKNPFGASGAARLNVGSYSYGVEFWNGGKHNVYLRAYSTLESCLLKYYYNGGNAVIMAVWNEDYGTGVESWTFLNTTADATNPLASATGGTEGFDGHVNVSGTLGTNVFRNITILGKLANGIGGTVDANGGSIAATVASSMGLYGGTVQNMSLPSILVAYVPISIDSCQLGRANMREGGTVTNSTVSDQLYLPAGTLSSTGNTFSGSSIGYGVLSGATFTSDYNTFSGQASTTPGYIQFVTKTRAQWQALGYDVNSTFH